MLTTWIFATFTNQLILAISAAGFYFLMAAFQIAAIAFIIVFLKETKGKSKEECEMLYAQEAYNTLMDVSR